MTTHSDPMSADRTLPPSPVSAGMSSERLAELRRMFVGKLKVEIYAEEWREIDAEVTRLRTALEAAAEFVRNIATNFDHDADAHRYGNFCRVCEAEALRPSRAPLPEETP